MGYTRTISRYDNGCSHHPDCFSCPFTDCLHDRPSLGGVGGGQPGARSRAPGGRFNRMVAQGITPMGAAGVLACHEGVIVQTIQRRLEKARESYKEAP